MRCPSPSSAATLALIAAVAFSVSACSGETATPVDLDELATPTSTTTASADGVPDRSDDDTNAASRELARRYAEQQCFDDPDAEEGVIEIAHPDTKQVVARIEVDCAEVRAANPDGLPEPPPDPDPASE